MPIENYTLIFIGVCLTTVVATSAVYVFLEALDCLSWRGLGVAIAMLAGCGVLLGIAALMAIGLFRFAFNQG